MNITQPARVRLVSVHTRSDAYRTLWAHLTERLSTPVLNISHTRMPSRRAHSAFVRSRPYKAWYLIERRDEGVVIGNCYLTRRSEIGIYIVATERGEGLGREAVLQLMDRWPRRRYLLNINPGNERSIRFFQALGAQPLQVTLQLIRGGGS